MIKKIVYYIFILVLFCFISNAQSKVDSLSINFKLKFTNSPLVFNKQYITTNKDTLAFENFKCYISSIQIHYTDNTVFKQKDSYHLLDFENKNSFNLPITKTNEKIISKVTFNIGIDSLTNTAGALSGDLDPVKGMYWAWQSGYINMKIEGKSSSCNTRKNEFHFHIGGYLPPYNALRKIEILIQKIQIPNNEINLVIDLEKLFSEIQLKETNSIMIPGKEAMRIADLITKLFSVE